MLTSFCCDWSRCKYAISESDASSLVDQIDREIWEICKNLKAGFHKSFHVRWKGKLHEFKVRLTLIRPKPERHKIITKFEESKFISTKDLKTESELIFDSL